MATFACNLLGRKRYSFIEFSDTEGLGKHNLTRTHMLVEELISDSVYNLKTTDLVADGLVMMEDYKVNHLPVVYDTEYIGLVSEDDLLELDEQIAICSQRNSYVRPYALKGQHIYDLIKIMSVHRISTCPVLDDKENYLGLITIQDLAYAFERMAAVSGPGGIIVLELNINDYSLSQIAQIVEGNDAKILSSYIEQHEDSTKLNVVLKINREDLSGIRQSFGRFNYTVAATFHQSVYDEDIQKRMDEFLHFLNI